MLPKATNSPDFPNFGNSQERLSNLDKSQSIKEKTPAFAVAHSIWLADWYRHRPLAEIRKAEWVEFVPAYDLTMQNLKELLMVA